MTFAEGRNGQNTVESGWNALQGIMTRGKAKGQLGTEKVAPKNTNCARLGSRLKEKDEVGKENRCQPLFVSALCLC